MARVTNSDFSIRVDQIDSLARRRGLLNDWQSLHLQKGGASKMASYALRVVEDGSAGRGFLEAYGTLGETAKEAYAALGFICRTLELMPVRVEYVADPEGHAILVKGAAKDYRHGADLLGQYLPKIVLHSALGGSTHHLSLSPDAAEHVLAIVAQDAINRAVRA